MSFLVFAPNKKISGGALIAKLNDKNDLWVSVFSQIANNPDKKGNFDMQNGINLKFNNDEISDIIRAVRTSTEMSFYHTFEGNETKGSFRFYEMTKENKTYKGFSFTVIKGEKTIKVNFSLAVAEHFCEYLRYCLQKSFEAGYQEDLEKSREYQENKKKTAEKPKSEVKKTTKPTPKPEEKEQETEGELETADVDF